MTDPAAVVAELTAGTGFAVLPHAVPAELLVEARDRLTQIMARQRAAGRTLREENRERVYGLLHEDPVFWRLLERSPVFEIARLFLANEAVCISGFSAHILEPGHDTVGIHVDYPYFLMRDPLPAFPPLGIQAIWALDDFRVDNGAPYFVPGSQKLRRKPEHVPGADKCVPIVADAGALVISHALCWHDCTANRSQGARIALLANVTPVYIRPIENPTFGVSADALVGDAEMRRVLGLEFYDTAPTRENGRQEPRRMNDVVVH
ncbi:MAG: phytanoyl-CoA dioxygenase family protein [Alphaproteobacteria bacterium]|nr:MAG: phytanoyl-CoA dioxygenase family protein [Alphaproteobacteria bacterium]